MAIEMKVAGLDIANNVFQVHGVDHRGKTVLRNGFVDLNSQSVFLQQILWLIGVEAAPGAYYWGVCLKFWARGFGWWLHSSSSPI
jgi:transposase